VEGDTVVFFGIQYVSTGNMELGAVTLFSTGMLEGHVIRLDYRKVCITHPLSNGVGL
jgi:hypothetical protein